MDSENNSESEIEELNKKFIDGLNNYFKLKSEYENNIKKEKLKISKISELSWKEKRLEFLKLKPKCINCKRPVGTLFSNFFDKKTYERQYIAICGDRKNPCPLDIKINLGFISNIIDSIHDNEVNMNKHKRNIIIDKNDLLFGYTTEEEAIIKFDNIKNIITESTPLGEGVLQQYLNVVDNSEKKEELKKLQMDYYNNMDNYNLLIQQYNTNNNIQNINDAVELNIKTINPKITEIIHRKNAINNIDYNENDNTFHLIQNKYSIKDFEDNIGIIGQSIISFKTGIENFSTKEVKSKILPAIPDIKEKINIQNESSSSDSVLISNKDNESSDEDTDEDNNSNESEEESEDSDSDNEANPLPKIKIYPKILPDGTITALEANNLKYNFEIINKELFAIDPESNNKYKITIT